MILRRLPLLLLALPVLAQDLDLERFDDLRWRCIGPWRGGRATAVEGVPSQPHTFYMGATGGGVWRTDDGGTTWRNLSDDHFGVGTIGAIAVAPSDPNVVYVGTGEAQVRGVTTSHGDGVYRSDDGGQTWRHLGLADSRHVAAVRVHPADPDTVWVAAQGELWAPNETRGVYRSTDGGVTWKRVLFVDEDTGCASLVVDPTNPRVLFAGTWQHRRHPWRVESGGAGSGVWRSLDGGDSWERLEVGLPALMGKVGVTVSPAEPSRVWAIVEADEGGLFRSDDRGATWRRVNAERVLRARAWYYTRVVADPVDANTVYVLNAPVLRSIDGGERFAPVPTPHGDNHALWIHPEHPQWMINGNDGGANVSFNGGRTWSTQSNQPTAQFYRVITDAGFPYRVYGGQQDNSTVSIASRTAGGGIDRTDWHPVSGGESAFIAFDPADPRHVYGGVYQGIISEWDRETGARRDVMAVPYLGLGADPRDLPYRFNWNAPIVASPQDPRVIYHAGNVVLRSTDRGRSWDEASPDLTRDEEDKQGRGGGPITNEAAGAETYNTISYLACSPHDAGTLWAGSDDGLVHVTRDGGASWMAVTPPGIGAALVNAIEVSPHDPASAFVAVTAYKLGDKTPHVFVTRDYGASWERRVDGLPSEAYVRVVREDPTQPGLLYAGTEGGAFISFDAGGRWQSLRLGLPPVAITDLAVRDGDLVAATQGRAFWILDDLSVLRQLEPAHIEADLVLFAPRDVRSLHGGGWQRPLPDRGQNPPPGALLHYWIGEGFDAAQTPLALEVRDVSGEVLRSYASDAPDGGRLSVAPGLHRVHWDLRLEGVTPIPGQFTYGSPQGPRVAPGRYVVYLSAGAGVAQSTFTYHPDPRVEHDPGAWAEQQVLVRRLHAAADGLHRDIVRARGVRAQLEALAERDRFPLAQDARAITSALTAWEDSVVQVKQETFQDVINFPGRLNAELLDLLGKVDGNGADLTEGLRAHSARLLARADERAAVLNEVMEDVGAFNAAFSEQRLSVIEISGGRR